MRILIQLKCSACGRVATVHGSRIHDAVEPDPQSVEEEFAAICPHANYTGDDSHEILEWDYED
jgi:hypothetical protein